MYSCHSHISPKRLLHETVHHSQNKTVFWANIFTRTCQYDNKLKDKKCFGCKQNPKSLGAI